MKYIVAIVFGLFIGVYLQANNPRLLEYWYSKHDILYRGDKVKLNLPKEHSEFYKNCKATFIASQATQTNNIAFVYLTGCDFQKNGEFEDPITEMFPLEYLEKLK